MQEGLRSGEPALRPRRRGGGRRAPSSCTSACPLLRRPTARPTSPTSRPQPGEIADVLDEGAVVVNKSTVPVGSTKVVERVLERPDVSVVSNPEFLREGSAVHDFMHPDRIVVGADDRAAAARVAVALPGRLRAVHRHRPGLGRDHQVRRQRLPGHQDLLRQRHRGGLRGGRRRRGRRRARHRLGQADRPRVPAAGPGLGRFVLPEGQPRAGPDRRERRLRLRPPPRRHLGQRPPALPDRREDPPGRGRFAGGRHHRRVGADLQGPHGRPARLTGAGHRRAARPPGGAW